MKVLAFLADQAQIDPQQKVHAIGINWTHTQTPAPTIAVVVLVEVLPDETPAALSVDIELLDSDGKPVKLPPPWGGEPEAFKATTVGTAGRQAPDQQWVPTRVPFLVQIGAGMPLPPGDYEFRITVSRVGGDTQIAHLRFAAKSPGMA